MLTQSLVLYTFIQNVYIFITVFENADFKDLTKLNKFYTKHIVKDQPFQMATDAVFFL